MVIQLGSTVAEVIKEINRIAENSGGGSLDTSADFGWTGDHSFNGEVDFSNDNVIGLNVSGGIKKTKITLAELRTMLSNSANNLGKIIQIIYKGTNATIKEIFSNLGSLYTIGSSTISKRLGNTSPSESAIYGTNYQISVTSLSAYVTVNSWDFDIENRIVNITNGTQWNINDTDFEIFVFNGE